MQYKDILALSDKELGKGKCIFLLDDEVHNSDYLGHHISHMFGAEIQAFTSPGELILNLEKRNVDNVILITDDELGVLKRGKNILKDIIKPSFPDLHCIIRSNNEGLYDAGSFEGIPVVTKSSTMVKINDQLRSYFRSMLCQEHHIEPEKLQEVINVRPLPFVTPDYKKQPWTKVKSRLQEAFPDKPVEALIKHLLNHPDFRQEPKAEAVKPAITHVWQYLDTGKTSYTDYLASMPNTVDVSSQDDQTYVDALRLKNGMGKTISSHHQHRTPDKTLKNIIHETSLRAPKGMLPCIEDDNAYVRSLQQRNKKNHTHDIPK